MKYVVCVPDGAADEPVAELGGHTPLEAAAMPNLAALAARSEVGRAATIPDGFPAGSDVGNLSILGYDPVRYHTGRAPIEAAAMGLRLRPDQVAYRCNLVTVGADGTMVDFAGGHPPSEAAAEVIAALDEELGGDGVSFHPGVQYRHIVVAPASWADAECTPPHDLTGQPAVWPSGPAAPRLRELMEA
jgi:2,3-bisphosphoglycerate-independent phosphoglycerate mutase